MATTKVSPGMATPSDVALAEETFKPMRERAEEFGRQETDLSGKLKTAEGELKAAEEARNMAVKEAEQQATSDFAKEQRGMVEKTQEKIEKHPFPTFKPTQENVTSYAQLGSMIATMGVMLGAGGKGSAKVAIGSLTGMMNGWQKGRKDLWEKEAKTFEKELQRIKLEHESIYKDLDMGMKLLATDREAGKAKLMNAAYRAGTGSIIETYVKHGKLKEIQAISQSMYKMRSGIDKNVMDSAIQERRHKEQITAQESARRATIEAANIRARGQIELEGVKAKNTTERDAAKSRAEIEKINEQADVKAREKIIFGNRGKPGDDVKTRLAEARIKQIDAAIKIANDKAKEGGGKAPAKDVTQRNDLRLILIPKLDAALPVLERIYKEGNWTKMTAALAIDSRAAEYLFRNDPEAINLILTFAYFRSKEFETAGKALTVKEDQILAPIVRADLRAYEGIRNAMVEGKKTLRQEQLSMEKTYPYIRRVNEEFRKQMSEGSGAGKTYRIGEVIEQGGKKYKVTGISDPSDPDVEEIE